MLTRDQMLAHADTRLESVEVPLLGGAVMIGRFSVADADRIAFLGPQKREDGTLAPAEYPTAAELVVMGCRDDKGAPLFTRADLATLATLPADALAPLATAILKFNGMGADKVPDDAAAPDAPPAKPARARRGAAKNG